MSNIRSSSIVHKEDGGLVYSSIRNDGMMIHWCDKCNRIWVSTEKPEREVSEEKEMVRKRKFSRLEIDEAKAYLQRFKVITSM